MTTVEDVTLWGLRWVPGRGTLRVPWYPLLLGWCVCVCVGVFPPPFGFIIHQLASKRAHNDAAWLINHFLLSLPREFTWHLPLSQRLACTCFPLPMLLWVAPSTLAMTRTLCGSTFATVPTKPSRSLRAYCGFHTLSQVRPRLKIASTYR